jgi:L-aminoadipate-semialdehyde dehydrogenase
MSEEFGISESDRFTMLSGIAHDPIQRDIFTPLFFGAELHVPTADDIGTPGRLSQWMAKQAVTITHLTPAMGQLLSANANTAIPSLKAAFFVGDILTKRDCHRLQHLAQNCRIINMYGTTETQRAVSYFTIPALSEDSLFLTACKEVIPAGRGMKDVQLLVVNRISRKTCGVGEVGEIYVRSSGLSEGYLKLEEITKEKFLTNWLIEHDTSDDAVPSPNEFYKGLRDRMYRTGDLGRYRPDGNGKQ